MRIRRRAPLLVGIAILIIAGTIAAVVRRESTIPSTAQCLDRPAKAMISLPRALSKQYKVDRPPDGHTYDARRTISGAYPFEALYPISLGKDRPAERTCVLGGTVVGQQSRELGWEEMKQSHDGSGLRLAANTWSIVDGLRVANVEDGIDPRGTEGRFPKDGDGFVLRNAYFTYIRDDCVENDDIAGGVIEDSLFDGCYTGISENPSNDSQQRKHRAPSGETLTLQHVLLRLEAMPVPRGREGGRGHGELFKWSSVGNRLVIRDSIFLVEATPNGGSAHFPPGTKAENVTVVWLGTGPFPGRVPESVHITRDRSVWDRARASWLTRHGCRSFDDCSNLLDPSEP